MNTINEIKYISKLTNEELYELITMMKVFPKQKFDYNDLAINRYDSYIAIDFLPAFEMNKTAYIDGNPDSFRLEDFKSYDDRKPYDLIFNEYMENKFGKEYRSDKLAFENSKIKERIVNNIKLIKDEEKNIEQKNLFLVEKIQEKEIAMTRLFGLLSKNKELNSYQNPTKYLSQLSDKEIIKIINSTDVFPTNLRGKRKMSVTRKEKDIYIESGNYNRYNVEHYDNYRGSIDLTDYSGLFYKNKEVFENQMLDRFGSDYAYDKLNFEKNELEKEIGTINKSFNDYKNNIKNESLNLSTIYNKNVREIDQLLKGNDKEKVKENNMGLEL